MSAFYEGHADLNIYLLYITVETMGIPSCLSKSGNILHINLNSASAEYEPV